MSGPRLEQLGEGRCRLEGEVSVETAPALVDQAGPLFTRGASLEIDCSGIVRADSAAVALMLEWMRQARAHGGRVSFRGLPERVRAIVEVSDLDDVIPVAN